MDPNEMILQGWCIIMNYALHETVWQVFWQLGKPSKYRSSTQMVVLKLNNLQLDTFCTLKTGLVWHLDPHISLFFRFQLYQKIIFFMRTYVYFLDSRCIRSKSCFLCDLAELEASMIKASMVKASKFKVSMIKASMVKASKLKASMVKASMTWTMRQKQDPVKELTGSQVHWNVP